METVHEMEGRFIPNVIVWKGAVIFQRLDGEDQTLLVWGEACFVLDFSLDVLDGVGRLNFQSNGFAGEGFDEDLHFGNLFSKELFEIKN